jgi:MSHA biogenesis protein MshI
MLIASENAISDVSSGQIDIPAWCLRSKSKDTNRLLAFRQERNVVSIKSSLARVLARNKNNKSQRIALMKGSGWLELIASKNGEIIATEDIPLVDDSSSADGSKDGNHDSLRTAVKTFCEQHGLEKPACTIVLPADGYQMLLVEAPPVEAQELAEALRWKVKDLLQTSVDDSIVDGFLLPDDAYRGRQKMAYTIATSRSELQSLVDTLSELDVEVDRVEVPELVLLQLLQNYPREEQTEMVLLIGRQRGFLAVIADQAIYLSRSLELSDEVLQRSGARALDANGPVDSFILEVQRSRDYFESQIGKGVVGRILLAPLVSDATPIVEAIKERLGADVELMDSSVLIPAVNAQGINSTMAGAEALLLASAASAA